MTPLVGSVMLNRGPIIIGTRFNQSSQFALTFRLSRLKRSFEAEFRPYLELLPVIDKQLDRIIELFRRHRSKIDRKDFELLEKKVATLAR